MATYASYKKVATDSIVDGTVQSADIAHGNGNNMGVAWVYNARGMACHTMLQKQLIQLRDVSTVYVLVVLGHVVKHTLVVHQWAVSHILMDII